MHNSRNQIIKTREAASLWWSRSHCLRGFSSKLPVNLFDLQLGGCWRRPSGKSPLAVLHTWDLPEKMQDITGEGCTREWGFTRVSRGNRAEFGSLCCLLKCAPGTLTLQATCRPDLEDYCLRSRVAAASGHLREPRIRAGSIKRGNPFQHCTADLDCFY